MVMRIGDAQPHTKDHGKPLEAERVRKPILLLSLQKAHDPANTLVLAQCE